jgi:hypothetical protein
LREGVEHASRGVGVAELVSKTLLFTSSLKLIERLKLAKMLCGLNEFW